MTTPTLLPLTAADLPPLLPELVVIGGAFALLGIGQDATGWMARGFALGTAAHGIGAARALQVHPDAGAWAALALGLQVVVASLLIPLVAGWF